MEVQKSEEYKKAEGRMAAVLFTLFLVWCPTYLFVARPRLNEFIANHINGYPAILHLVPILVPIVVVALVMGRTLPPRNE